jgi:hypothetical protein
LAAALIALGVHRETIHRRARLITKQFTFVRSNKS